MTLTAHHAEVPCLVTEDYLHHLWEDRRTRYRERDRTGNRVRQVLANNYQEGWRDVIPAGTEPVVANLIKSAARTVTQRVGRYPRITADPVRRRTSDAAIKRAETHEIQLGIDLRKIGFRATLTQACYWLVTHDCMPLVLRPSPFYGVPVIEVKDPLSCYPGTVWPHKPEIYDVLFAQTMPAFQAVRMYPQVATILSQLDAREDQKHVVLGEYIDETGMVVCLLEPRVSMVDWLPSIVPGQSTVFIGRGFSEDLEFHGQFDHSIPVLIAQAKLTGLVMTLAEHNVFSETNVFAEFAGNQTKYNWGPGAVNFFMPTPGGRVEKSINTMNPQVFNELDRFERAIRMDAGYPGQMSGEPVATIATGKGLEELTVTVDDNVNYWQTVVQDTLIRALTNYSEMAIAMRSPDYDNYQSKGTLNLMVRHLASSDPAETVKFLQLTDGRMMARRSVMERLDDVPEAEIEERMIDSEQMRDAILKGIEQRAAMPPEQGGMDPSDIARLVEMRKAGTALEDAVAKLAKEKQAAAMAQQAQGAPGASAGAPSIQDMVSQAMGGQSPGTSLGQARTAERLMSQPQFLGTAGAAAGAGNVARQLGGAPAMPGGAPGGPPPV
jgi:hypothetical protein